MNKISLVSAVSLGLAIGVVSMAGSGCGKSAGAAGGADTIATVNGTPITQEEYLRYLMLKPSVTVVSPEGRAVSLRPASTLGFQALEDLVQQKLVVQMAKDQGVYPTDKQIDEEVAFRVKQDPNFVKRLSMQGLNTELIKSALAVEMSQFNLLTKGITVTPSDVDNYIKSNPKRFTQPPSIDMLWILVRSEKTKDAAEEELRRGQPFDQVAMRYSEATNAKQSRGMFPFHQLTQLPKELQGPIGNTAVLKSTDWIKASDGWAKFYVQKRTPAKPIPTSSPETREMIRRQIMLQRGQGGVELTNRIKQKMQGSQIAVSEPGLQDSWKQFEDRLKSGTSAPSLEQSVQNAPTGSMPASGGAANAPATTSGK